VEKSRDEMKNDIEKTQKTVSIKKLQDDLENLRDEVRRLETKMAALSNVETAKIAGDADASEPPHEATGKCQRCKNCKHMRYPHKSNAHYTCALRHETIETTWTCGLFNDKNKPKILEPVAYCGH
jgi:chromosome segregation ATPase